MIKIGEFAKMCGTTLDTIRHYEVIDLLVPAAVDKQSGYRFYTEEQVNDYLRIKHLQSAGFKLEFIKQLLKEDEVSVLEAFEQRINELKGQIEKVEEARIQYIDDKAEYDSKYTNTKKSCLTCEFNFGDVCAGGMDLGNGKNTYGMPMDAVMKLFPHGCPAWGISIQAYLAEDEENILDEADYVTYETKDYLIRINLFTDKIEKIKK